MKENNKILNVLETYFGKKMLTLREILNGSENMIGSGKEKWQETAFVNTNHVRQGNAGTA